MEPIKRILSPAPAATLGAAAKRGAVTALKLFIPFALIAVALWQMPVNHNVVAPEHGAAQQAQVDDVMAQCEPLAEGTLPGAVVIDYVGQAPRYTAAAKHVDAGFDVALGQPNPRIEGVTLCR